MRKELVEFAQANPQINIKVKIQPNAHPGAEGKYSESPPRRAAPRSALTTATQSTTPCNR